MQHSPYIDHPEALWFWERLLASRHRTIDPREADFFYVPLLIRNRDSGKQRLISETIAFIRSLGPFWDAKGGADHIFLVSEEYGKCALQLHGLEDPRLKSAITLTPWGYTRNMLGTAEGGPCFRPGQDIVIPPSAHLRFLQNASMVREAGGLPGLVREGGADGEGEVQQQGQQQVQQQGQEQERQQQEGGGGQGQGGRERQYLLFVRGLNVSDGGSGWDEEAHQQEQGEQQQQRDNKQQGGQQQQVQAVRKEQGEPPFSFGVRQRVFELYAGRDAETGFKVEVVPEGGEELAYGGMEHSVFCLATAGHGWHASLAMAVIAGCVPIVIQFAQLRVLPEMAGLLSSSMQGSLLKLPAAAPISAPPSRTLTAVVAHSGASPSRRQTAASKRPLSTPLRASELTAIDTFTAELDELEGMVDGEYEEVPVHTVTVHDRERGVTYTVDVPQDQYILQTAEEEGIKLPFACRHGCCTACAVRVISGELVQPRALGISQELKEKGYALLCVGIPLSDLEVETQDEDEVYWQQFGKYFARGPIERDDYALELAMQDERSCCYCEAAILTAAASFAAKTDADSKEGSSQQKFAERPLLRNAIIVGGGIAGLTAAIALRRQGVDVQVYEKAEGRDPERVGRMVGIQSNGLAALRCIDPAIAGALPSQGAHVPSLWQLAPSGEVLLEALAPADGRIAIRWGLALEVLQSFLPESCVHQGCEFTRHVEQANGRVTAHFTRHGQPFSAEADLLIGTDGVRSAVRQLVLRDGEERERWGPPRDNGRTMWLGAAPREAVTFEHSRPYRTCFTRGDGRTAAVGDLGGAEIFVLFVCADEQGRGLTEQRSGDGEEVRGKIRALFADWPAYRDVIEAIPPDLFLERRVLDVPPLPRWRNGRILVIGDAAHAVPPTLGQGSSLAIEDALELARQVVAAHPSLECVVKCCCVPLLVACLLSAGSVQ
ncbi:unnamed protein product [Closterium sp. Naga37s-1]|nr:unnamed protein product [Closterium sp. Naga37s-1]